MLAWVFFFLLLGLCLGYRMGQDGLADAVANDQADIYPMLYPDGSVCGKIVWRKNGD